MQPALNEIHKFCFQHWSRGHGTCGIGSGAPDLWPAPTLSDKSTTTMQNSVNNEHFLYITNISSAINDLTLPKESRKRPLLLAY